MRFLLTWFILGGWVVVNSQGQNCPVLTTAAGGRINCTNLNNVDSVCTIICDAEYILNTTETSVCQGNGSWTVEELGCKFVGSSICTIQGNAHFLTFDGVAYDFQGTCLYRMVESSATVGLLKQFVLSVESEFRSTNQKVSRLKRALLKVDNHTFEYAKSRKVLHNGIFVNAPFNLEQIGISIFRSGSSLVTSTAFGLTISYDGKSNMEIELSNSYSGFVSGLCGNMNGITSDEFTLAHNETVIGSASEFGNSHKIGGDESGCTDGRQNESFGNCMDMDAYRELCNIFNSECFEECRAILPTPGVIQNCIFDMCVSNGDLTALEQVISQYARRCQKIPVNICDWRNNTNIPDSCPANSRYEHEGTACPNTCLDRDSAESCILFPISGCVCNDEFVLSGDECVLISDCGCAEDGIYYVKGATFYKPGCEKWCTCENAILSCSDTQCSADEVCRISPATRQLDCLPESYGECVAHGDPHYETFDGKFYDYMGACTYLLVEVTNPLTGETFKVITDNEFRNGDGRVSWVKNVQVIFKFENATVDILMSKQVAGMAATITNLFNNPVTLIDYQLRNLKIFQSGKSIVLIVDNFRVTFNGFNVRVSVPVTFKAGNTRGLCGDWNGDPTDDFKLFNGTEVDDVSVFAMSWKVGNCSVPGPIGDFNCTTADRITYSGLEYCGKIKSPAFSECLALISLENDFLTCVFDLCATNGDVDVLELILLKVITKCREVTPLCDVRSEIGLPELVCPENSNFQTCTTACPDTCNEPTASIRCPLPDIDACVCNFGYIYENGNCVREDMCGCYPESSGFVAQGVTEMNSNCTHQCTCAGPNQWLCGPFMCEEDEMCLPSGGSFQCVNPNFGHCMIWGPTYISTFDGTQYYFDGTCSYTAVGALKGENWPEFAVVVDRDYRLPCGRTSMFVNVGISPCENRDGIQVEIYTGSDHVKINGLTVLPGSDYKGVQVIYQSNFIVVKFQFGLVVRASWQQGVIVSVNGQLREQVNGLCGFFNNDPTDDFAIDFNETLASNSTEFGNAWKFHKDQDYICDNGKPPEDPPCPESRYNEFIDSPMACGLLDRSLFSACLSSVDHQQIKRSCRASLCQEGKCFALLENWILALTTECVLRGGEYPDWRDELWMEFKCPESSHYATGSDLCQPTCSDRDVSWCRSMPEFSLKMQAPSTEYCICDEGYILSGTKCVALNRCGCLSSTDGIYYAHGGCRVDASCQQKCQCRNGVWDCEHDPCTSDQYCGLREGEWGCHFKYLCRYNNGDCEQRCRTVDQKVVCECFPGYGLTADGKSCLRTTSGNESSCTSTLNEWRESYTEWKDYYEKEWKKAFENYKREGISTSGEPPRAWEFPDDAFSSSCKVAWTEWFNSDNPSGCGDNESLERIRSLYPGEICSRPIAFETKIVSLTTPSPDSQSEVLLRLNSHVDGLLCDNSDQADDVLCPDYAVKFLCFD